MIKYLLLGKEILGEGRKIKWKNTNDDDKDYVDDDDNDEQKEQ